MAFIDELNAAVGDIGRIPRVRFEAGLSAEASHWIRKKHLDGMVHEPGTLGALMAIAKCYPESKTIFDIGALYGYFALFASMVFEKLDLTAFDMHPVAVKDLRENCAPFGIKCVNAVLTDEVKPAQVFWVSGFNIYEEPLGGWEELKTIPGAMKERGYQNRGRFFAKVKFTTLDEYCATNPPPDVMKIDVEGYQAKCLQGGMNTIEAYKPVIVIELHDPDKLERFGVTNKSTVQPLFDLGYRGYWCGNFRDKDAVFEPVDEMTEKHEKLSIMVLHA